MKQSELTAATRTALERYLALLGQWNSTVRLVSPQDMGFLWDRHVRDSLQLLDLIPPGTERIIDLGSGGGFPGLVLAIAGPCPVTLVESDQRKSAFLREVIQQLGLDAQVHAVRIEAATLAPAPVVTARALASLDRLCAYATPLLAPGGRALFLKGAGAEAEIAAARQNWSFDIDSVPSITDPQGRILVLSGLHPKAAAA